MLEANGRLSWGELAMRSLIWAAACGIAMAAGSQAALAFTYENQGGSSQQSSASANVAPTIGFSGMDPKSVLPPIGESISGSGFDYAPSSFNNGMAQQPTRSNSVGPSWLYPPGR